MLQASLGFLSYGLCASSVYLLNDLLDLESDRHHPRKRFRPLAAGTVPLQHGMILIPVLLLCSLGIALFLPIEFLVTLGVYYAFTLAYSLRLKSVVLLDVLILAGLYTLRIIAGGAAVSVVPSFWLLAFSMFLFFSLAVVKRYSELLALQKSNQSTIKGRGYVIVDLETLISLGASSGHIAVLVLALYINSTDVIQNYSHPQVIWLLCPLLLYWMARVWMKTRRGQMLDDPVIFALRDKISFWVGVVAIIILLLAT